MQQNFYFEATKIVFNDQMSHLTVVAILIRRPNIIKFSCTTV